MLIKDSPCLHCLSKHLWLRVYGWFTETRNGMLFMLRDVFLGVAWWGGSSSGFLKNKEEQVKADNHKVQCL